MTLRRYHNQTFKVSQIIQRSSRVKEYIITTLDDVEVKRMVSNKFQYSNTFHRPMLVRVKISDNTQVQPSPTVPEYVPVIGGSERTSQETVSKEMVSKEMVSKEMVSKETVPNSNSSSETVEHWFDIRVILHMPQILKKITIKYNMDKDEFGRNYNTPFPELIRIDTKDTSYHTEHGFEYLWYRAIKTNGIKMWIRLCLSLYNTSEYGGWIFNNINEVKQKICSNKISMKSILTAQKKLYLKTWYKEWLPSKSNIHIVLYIT